MIHRLKYNENNSCSPSIVFCNDKSVKPKDQQKLPCGKSNALYCINLQSWAHYHTWAVVFTFAPVRKEAAWSPAGPLNQPVSSPFIIRASVMLILWITRSLGQTRSPELALRVSQHLKKKDPPACADMCGVHTRIHGRAYATEQFMKL